MTDPRLDALPSYMVWMTDDEVRAVLAELDAADASAGYMRIDSVTWDSIVTTVLRIDTVRNGPYEQGNLTALVDELVAAVRHIENGRST